MSKRTVSVSRVINASAQKIFDVVADPAMHPVIDGSGTVKTSNAKNPSRLSQGAQFGMGMKIGASYRIKNTVVEFEDGKRIGWQHAGKHIWRYEFEPHEDATLVTESIDFTHARSKPLLVLLGPIAKKRYTDAMKATLERLDKQVTSG